MTVGKIRGQRKRDFTVLSQNVDLIELSVYTNACMIPMHTVIR